jgi:hypothetical protein
MPRLNNFAQKNATQHKLAQARKANTTPADVKRKSQKKKKGNKLLRLHRKEMFARAPDARGEEPAAIIPADLELKGCCLGGGRLALHPISSNELRLRVPTRKNRDADPEWSSTCDKGASSYNLIFVCSARSAYVLRKVLAAPNVLAKKKKKKKMCVCFTIVRVLSYLSRSGERDDKFFHLGLNVLLVRCRWIARPAQNKPITRVGFAAPPHQQEREYAYFAICSVFFFFLVPCMPPPLCRVFFHSDFVCPHPSFFLGDDRHRDDRRVSRRQPRVPLPHTASSDRPPTALRLVRRTLYRSP